MKILITLLIALTLTACGDATYKPSAPGPDQCLRAELFQSCLKSVPAGPNETKYNDWNEVVRECQYASYYQSLRKLSAIKQECQV